MQCQNLLPLIAASGALENAKSVFRQDSLISGPIQPDRHYLPESPSQFSRFFPQTGNVTLTRTL
jgi:hypothetical protein